MKTCTRCGETQKEPLYWTLAAWMRADQTRTAFSHKLCLTCITAKIAPLQVHSDDQGMTCPGCGIDTTTDYDAIYITWIPKGVGKLQAELPFCNACAAHWRIWFEEGAMHRESEGDLSRGRDIAPRYTADETLASLGIRPRA